MSLPASCPAEDYGLQFKTLRSIRILGGLTWLIIGYTWLLGHFPWKSLPWRLPLSALGSGQQPIPFYPLCLFKGMVYLPCLFCGLTRSFILLGQGHWQASLQYHLMGIPVYITAFTFASLSVVYPKAARGMANFLSARPMIFGIIGCFLLAWFWKLSQSPVFW